MIIYGIYVKDRHSHANKLQEVLTEHGDIIRTRLGLHDGSGSGTIIIQLDQRSEELEDKIKGLGLDIKSMEW